MRKKKGPWGHGVGLAAWLVDDSWLVGSIVWVVWVASAGDWWRSREKQKF